jgi:PAS domain S-box-containing protein
MMAESTSYKILFVEDLPTDAELAQLTLKAGGVGVASMRVDTKESFLAALASFAPDIVISDYSMPAFDGMTALQLARAADPLLPFIVLTGSTNEDTAVECMKAGASDYVIKEHMSRLPFAVKEALSRRKNQALAMEGAARLKESEERYRSLFEGSHAVMLIIDPEDGGIVEANRAAVDFYGWSRDELLGMRMGQINTLGDEGVRATIAKTISLKNRQLEAKHRLSKGEVRDVEIHSGLLVLGGKTLIFEIVHDITARVAAERERDDLSSRLRHYLATSPTVTYSLRIKGGEALWQWASENIQSLLGYSVQEVLAPDWWIRNVHPSDRMRALGGISKLAGSEAFGQEYRFLRKDRVAVWLRDEMHFSEGEGGEAEIVGTLTDVSERKKVEVDLSLKSAALEAAANAIIITDRDGNIQWSNPAFGRLTGFSRAETAGKNPGALIGSGLQGVDFYRELWDCILAGQVWRGQLVNKRKGGELYTEEMTITPVLDETKRVSRFIAIKNDVTEREASRRRLVASLAEKEELLHELHHRNYNTMQLIVSLLQLSIRDIDDLRLKDAMGGISRHIHSIAQVHEQFYDSGNMASIDFGEYLGRCADDMKVEYPRFLGSVLIETGTEPIPLALEKAIPAGLIAAELLSNALRYAYPEGSKQGNILVSLRRRGGEVELVVKDYGVGIPEFPGEESRGTLGMTLIHILAEQLGGKAEFRVSKGTEAVILFPAT